MGRIYNFNEFVNEGYLQSAFSKISKWAKQFKDYVKSGLVRLIPGGMKKGKPMAAYFSGNNGSVEKQLLDFFQSTPYAEATNFENIATGVEAENKEGVAKTKFSSSAMKDYGKASNELFTQFLARIALEIPKATIAMFSTLKYVNAPNFEKFRQIWNAKYLGGFVVHNKAFEGLTGNFPIGFLIWDVDIN